MYFYPESGGGAVLGWSRILIRSRPARSTFLLSRQNYYFQSTITAIELGYKVYQFHGVNK